MYGFYVFTISFNKVTNSDISIFISFKNIGFMIEQNQCSCKYFFQLFEQGLHTYTWRTEESADFIETANALVCVDIHTNLDIVQTNCHEIAQITISWSNGVLDIFIAREPQRSYDIMELNSTQQ